MLIECGHRHADNDGEMCVRQHRESTEKRGVGTWHGGHLLVRVGRRSIDGDTDLLGASLLEDRYKGGSHSSGVNQNPDQQPFPTGVAENVRNVGSEAWLTSRERDGQHAEVRQLIQESQDF